jgi:hypothetical protein
MSVHLDSILSTLGHAPLAKLSFKSINKARLERAAAAVVAHTNITNVDISHNSITSNDAVHVARIISHAPHVERLNISCNDFSGADGCRLIAAALHGNTVSARGYNHRYSAARGSLLLACVYICYYRAITAFNRGL